MIDCDEKTMSTPKLITSDDILRLRKMAGLTQKALSKKAGVSQSLIARIENKTIDPRLSTVKRIYESIISSQEERTAKDVMHSPVITVNYMDSVRKAIDLMKRHDISQIPILKEDRIIGSIQESTLIERIIKSGNPGKVFSLPVYDLMEKKFVTVNPTANIIDILNLLSRGEQAVLVIDGDQLVGIITKIDVLSSITHLERF